MRQLLDVMDETVELPLRIDLLLTSQGKAIESLVMPDIPEDRLDGSKALSVKRLAFVTVNRPFHPVGVAFTG